MKLFKSGNSRAKSAEKPKEMKSAQKTASSSKINKIEVGNFEPLKIEPKILEFWNKNNIHKKANDRNAGKQKFYFLQGPPYTSGRLHMGHAWNNSLKDMELRYKRMKGFDVWDRAGYDMHGLPTEHKVQAELNLKLKEDIIAYGVEPFVKRCIDFCTKSALTMDKDLERLGIWMDFKNAYWPIKNEYIEGEWWLIKKAHEKERLYEGLRTISWCKSCATALAKHEQEYKEVKETSIFVKFKVVGKDNEYLIIWTTTPWTIPFNLAVMVNPELEYVKCKVQVFDDMQKKEGKTHDEYWIVAGALANVFISSVAGLKYNVVEEFTGEKLEGLKYEHPLHDIINDYKVLSKKHEKIHSVVLSTEYVDTSAGTGLVHCAPGCGPEDYEVGYKNNLPAYNTIDEYGRFPQGIGELSGLVAKDDDWKFVEALEKRGAIIAKTKVMHDYAHCERCHNPIVFRTTKQWFFRTEDLAKNMLEANQDIKWVPEAGKNAFDSWLKNLRDNSITKQRFWGTPIPIWKCEKCNSYDVVGSVDELKKLVGKESKIPANLHKPWIDDVKYSCKKKGCNGTKIRIPDILDVWIDAGTASWNSLGYPNAKGSEALLKRLWPADFILEAKEQVRGWFNLLMVSSFIAFEKPCFKNVFMHGMLTDVEGVKMSKSLGNVISPYEIVDKYGADTLRTYCCATRAGEDMSFSWDEISLKNKKLMILWNLHKFLIDLAYNCNVNPSLLKIAKHDIEEDYIFSVLNSRIKTVTELYDSYKIDEVIALIEDIYLELSRSYIQLVRDKSSVGSDDEKHLVIYTIYNVLMGCLKMYSTVAPFITEQIYQDIKAAFGLKEESITLFSWPEYDAKKINKDLETDFEVAFAAIQGILAAREKAQLGVRWPLKEAVIVTSKDEIRKSVDSVKELIMRQANVKEIIVAKQFDKIKESVKPDYSKINPAFKELSARIIAKLALESPQSILSHLEKNGKFTVDLEKFGKVDVKREHFMIVKVIPDEYKEGEFRHASLYIDCTRTLELDGEGFAREIMRRVQSMRKNAGLEKKDRIDLYIRVNQDLLDMIENWQDNIEEKVGADALELNTAAPAKIFATSERFKIKDKDIEVFFDKI